MHFYTARPRPPPFNHQKNKEESSDVDLTWVVNVINKASLNVQDIRLKLDLSKVVEFLQNRKKMQRNRQHMMTFCPSPCQSQNQLNYSSTISMQKPKNSNFLKTDQSQLNINIQNTIQSQQFSSSFLTTKNNNNNPNKHILQSQLLVQQTSIVNNKENINEEQPMTLFKWRNVVTKNVLDDLDKESQCYKQIRIQNQRIKEQNQILKNCMIDILWKFKENDVISIQKNREELEIMDIEQCCHIIQDSQIINKISNFEAMMKQFQATIKVCQELKKQLQGKIQQCQKYQTLLYIKQQGLSSMKIVQKNLQKRIASLTTQRTSLQHLQEIKEMPFLNKDKDAGSTHE